MKAAWIAPFILALAATPALAADTGSNDQQTNQTQGSVSPNAINPGQGKQPDGYTHGGENQEHTNDFGPSQTANAEGDTDPGDDSNTGTDDNGANANDGASADGGSSTDSSASADNGTNTDS